MALPIARPAGRDLLVTRLGGFDLAQTLGCGQCFRWHPVGPGIFEGVAGGRFLRIAQQGDELTLYGQSPAGYAQFWQGYFSLDVDYPAILAQLRRDPVLARAADFAGGIRLLRQDRWEALASFILSQNNNIPRITGIIDRLCQAFGEPVAPHAFAFPPPGALACARVEDLSVLRCGFRARYLLDAARRVAGGALDLEAVGRLPTPQARQALMQVCGVGPKVADCTLLFGFGRWDCLPTDVWIARAMARWFPSGLPAFAQPYAGIAQQLLFYYARSHPQLLQPQGAAV